MANTFITPSWVTRDVAMFWKNSIKFAGSVNRSYDAAYAGHGAKVGYTVNARIPQRFQPVEGQALVQQAILNQTVPISITHQKHIGFGWSSADDTMIVEDVQERYTMPAGQSLANIVDADGLATCYPQVYNSIGTPGTAITSNRTYLQGVAKLRNFGVPGPYAAVLDELSMVELVNANATIFNPSAAISEQYREGQFGRDALGVRDWYSDPNVAMATTGTFTSSTPLVNGANQTGSSLITDGWASGAATLVGGVDEFTIAGVYSVNPISYVSTGALQQFKVVTTITSTTVNATITITPPIITSGPLQTVTASPADNAVITVLGATAASSGTLAATATKQSLIFNKNAFALVMADLQTDLAGADCTRINSKVSGVSLRMVEQYNIQTDQEPTRLDIIYGWAVVIPTFAIVAYS